MDLNYKIYGKYGNEKDKDFYSTIGKYALDQNVIGEMHDLIYGGLYDNTLSTWFIFYDNSDNIIGFICFYNKEKYISLEYFYIEKMFRNKGNGKKILRFCLDYYKELFKDNIIRIKSTTKNEILLNIYLNHGFVVKSKRGKYYYVEYN